MRLDYTTVLQPLPWCLQKSLTTDSILGKSARCTGVNWKFVNWCISSNDADVSGWSLVPCLQREAQESKVISDLGFEIDPTFMTTWKSDLFIYLTYRSRYIYLVVSLQSIVLSTSKSTHFKKENKDMFKDILEILKIKVIFISEVHRSIRKFLRNLRYFWPQCAVWVKWEKQTLWSMRSRFETKSLGTFKRVKLFVQIESQTLATNSQSSRENKSCLHVSLKSFIFQKGHVLR